MTSRYYGLLFVGIVLAGLLAILGVLEGTHRSSTAAASEKLKPVVEKHAGIIDKPSNHTVDETVDRLKDMLKAKGVTVFALVDHSGKGGNEDAAHQTADLRQPQGRHAAHAGRSSRGPGPSLEDSRLGRRRGEGLALLPQHKVLERAVQSAAG